MYKYAEDSGLCVVTTVLDYIKRTRSLIRQDEDALFITYGKTHKKPSKDTLRRWITTSLSEAGINIYTAHSTRHASASKSKMGNCCVQTILSKGGWKSESVFRRHYDLPIR